MYKFRRLLQGGICLGCAFVLLSCGVVGFYKLGVDATLEFKALLVVGKTLDSPRYEGIHALQNTEWDFSEFCVILFR